MKPHYWYYITIHCCPKCGELWEERERRYTERPKSWGKRNKVVDWLDHDCDEA